MRNYFKGKLIMLLVWYSLCFLLVFFKSFRYKNALVLSAHFMMVTERWDWCVGKLDHVD
jgi:hypothetical protein